MTKLPKILGLMVALGLSASASAQMMINGAGATFPYPIYSKWFDEYAKVDPSVRFNYQSIGSGGGQKQILAQTVDFGASDGPMSDENLAKAPGKLLHIPTVAGADVVTYNLPGNPKLKFDADTIAGVFLGQIKKWNDPKITALNPGVKLPDQEIVVVHRSDGSGTTYIWTDYLSKISPEWKSKVGTNTSVNWPTGIGGKGNEGVAGQVKQTPGALGYVELIYAIQNKMPYADVKNSAGEFVKPTLESITAALATAEIPDDFRFSMTNAPGKDAYPICGATWLAGLPTTKGCGERKETRGVSKMGCERRRKNGQGSRLRFFAGQRAATRFEADRRNQNVIGGVLRRPATAKQSINFYGCGSIDSGGRALRAGADDASIPLWRQGIRVAYAGDGTDGGSADYSDRLAALDRIFSRHQEIRFSFPDHINMGPGRRTIRCAALYLRNAGFFFDRATDRGSFEYRDGGVPHGTCSAVDSAAAGVLDRNVGRDSERDPGALGHFRHGPLVA